MTNREYFSKMPEQELIEVLCEMNETIKEYSDGCTCLMGIIFGGSLNAEDRHARHKDKTEGFYDDCSACIAEWLNEEHQDDGVSPSGKAAGFDPANDV